MTTLATQSRFDDTRSHRMVVLVIALIAAMLVLLAAQRPPSEAARAFATDTAEYADLHYRVEAVLGPIPVTNDPSAINRALQRLAAAIRDARPNAAEGDLFTPALAREIRQQLADALAANGLTVADVREMQASEGVPIDQVTLTVDCRYPWIIGAAMLPSVIDALPPLPPELQYRIVGDDLVLVDVHASLVVDILRSAVGQMTLSPEQ